MCIFKIYSIFKTFLEIPFTIFFCCFQLWKISPPGQGEVRQESRRSKSGVNEKCTRGQGKVRQESMRSASADYHTFMGCTSPWPLTQVSLTPDALLLDAWCTSAWPLTLIFQSWKKQKTWFKNNPKLFLKAKYIFKYSCALVVKS